MLTDYTYFDEQTNQSNINKSTRFNLTQRNIFKLLNEKQI